MSNIADKFEELGVIPVVVLNDTKDALPLAKALVEGGLHVQKLHSVQKQQRNLSVLCTKHIQIWYLQQVQYLQQSRLTEL